MKLAIVSRCAWTLYNFRRTLAIALESSGHSVTLMGGYDEYAHALGELGLKYSKLPIQKRGANPFLDLLLFFKLYIMFKSGGFTLAHFFTIKAVIYGSIAAWLANVPIRVATITGLGVVFTGSRPLLRRTVERLYRFSLQKCDVVFFQNRDDMDFFLNSQLLSPQKCRLVPGSGVDTKRFVPQSRIPGSELGGTGTHFLMMSRLVREKGVLEFLHAAQRVHARFPETQFTLVGGNERAGSLGIKYEEFCAKARRANMELLGHVDDVRLYLGQCDVVVLPSYREGVPRSLLEAAAMEKPIITTDVPGCREALIPNETGLIIQPRNIEALVDAMIYFIENRERLTEMGKAGRKWVVKNFDEKIVIDRTKDTYLEIATAKGLKV